MRLDPAGVVEQRRLEGRQVGKAREQRQRGQRLGPGGQALGLLVPDHLDPVLQGAQERVGRTQLVPGLPVDPALRDEFGQHRDRTPPPQGGLAAAEDELLGLNEELDLPDAAAADLDVVAADRDGLVSADHVDLPL